MEHAIQAHFLLLLAEPRARPGPDAQPPPTTPEEDCPMCDGKRPACVCETAAVAEERAMVAEKARRHLEHASQQFASKRARRKALESRVQQEQIASRQKKLAAVDDALDKVRGKNNA